MIFVLNIKKEYLKKHKGVLSLIKTYSKITTSLLAATLLISSPLNVLASSGATKNVETKKETLVVFENEKGKRMIEQMTDTEYVFENLPIALVHATPSQIHALKMNPNISLVEENKTYQAIPNQKPKKVNVKDFVYKHTKDEGESERKHGAGISSVALEDFVPYGVEYVGSYTAWKEGVTGKGVKVGVIDTGVSLNHEDIRVVNQVNFIPNEPNDDIHGHGTHVAGIIAASANDKGVVGVAPDAEIYSAKVAKSDGTVTFEDFVKGVDWGIEMGVDILNISLAFPPSEDDLFKEVIKKAEEKGILVVAAAGNGGTLIETDGLGPYVYYPANQDDVIGVSSVNSMFDLSWFSSYGKEIDIAAPGEEIVSLYLGNNYLGNNYGLMSGTSMAAPHVTGVLALMKQKYPQLSSKKLKDMLFTSALDIGNKGKDEFFGHGFVKYPNSTDANFYYENAKKTKEEELYQQRLNQAKDYIKEADSLLTLYWINQAKEAVRKLNDNDRVALEKQLKVIEQKYQNEIRLKKQIPLLIDQAKKELSLHKLNQASELVKKLHKREHYSYNQKIQQAKTYILNERVKKAKRLVTQAEKYKTKKHKKEAQDAVSILPKGKERSELQKRLNRIKAKQ